MEDKMAKMIGKIALVILLLGIVALNVLFMNVSGQEKISQKQAEDIALSEISGEVTEIEFEEDEETITPETLAQYPNRISESQAREIALKEKDGKVVNIKMEKENGKLIYEVEINSGSSNWEVEVDGETGKILEVEEAG